MIFAAALRSYATAAAKKTNDKGLKTKQVFMKKMKASRAASPPSQIGINRTAPLQHALFSVDPAHKFAARASASDKTEQQRREIIELAWSRHEGQRRAEREAWEQAFVEGKVRALNELREVSPRLFAQATKVDYGLPPVYRRLATYTAPNPDKFPITQEPL